MLADRARTVRRGLAIGCAALVTAACSTSSPPATSTLGTVIPSTVATGAQLASPTHGASPTPTPTPSASPSLSAQAKRDAAAVTLIGSKPGVLGIIVHDQVTGTTWRGGVTTHLTWTASTIKLAIVTSLLEQDRAGTVTLDDTDRQDMADILNWSSDDAATALWNKYGKSALVPRFQQVYGMKTLTFISGYAHFWGHMKCTPEDLMHLITYIMDKLDTGDRAYIVNGMQNVGPIQQWGVRAAGPALHPGTKDGWSIESDHGSKHWVTNAVGFAGPDQRYLVAVMYDVPVGEEIGDGVHAVSDLVATYFGAQVPAPVTVPDPSTGL